MGPIILKLVRRCIARHGERLIFAPRLEHLVCAEFVKPSNEVKVELIVRLLHRTVAGDLKHADTVSGRNLVRFRVLFIAHRATSGVTDPTLKLERI